MSDLAIRVEGLSKRYRIGARRRRFQTLHDRLAEAAAALFRRLRSTFRHSNLQPSNDEFIWALNDVSFEVRQGEVVGIIGRNGAGKSTLLKILCRITAPTAGRVEVFGRVGSLLEVGTGFHPELTGRENIYLNGAILGMRKAEIDRKFDAIVAFAEIEKFLDTAVRRYSSGMAVRLAFGVAAHLEPEILLVDEVLAVGDAAFQKKCLGKMDEVAKGGRTVLFVSHNMAAIQALCERLILLRAGRLEMHGNAQEVISCYLSEGVDTESIEMDLTQHPGRSRSREPALRKAWTQNGKGARSNSILMGESLTICFQFRCGRPIRNPAMGFGIEDQHGRRLFSLSSYMVPTEANTFKMVRSGRASVCIPNLALLPGVYFVSLSLVENQREWVDFVERALAFHVHPADVYGSGRIPEPSQGVMFVPGRITVEPEEEVIS